MLFASPTVHQLLGRPSLDAGQGFTAAAVQRSIPEGPSGEKRKQDAAIGHENILKIIFPTKQKAFRVIMAHELHTARVPARAH